MAISCQRATDERRALAEAIQRDFRALVELLNAESRRSNFPEAASVAANAERGLCLAEQLLAAIDAETT